MPTASSAQAARQGLADRLREIRVAAGVTGVQLAAAAGWHRTKVSKLEHGVTAPSADDIRAWCRACGADGEAEELVAALVASDSMWTEWRRMERAGLRQAQESVVPLWERTRRFRIYSSWLIPGPVQAEPYIRALLDATRARRGLADDVEEATAVRVAKQDVIHRPGQRFAILLEEAALRYRIGGRDVLRAQLEHLLAVMDLPAVSLGVIPLDADRVTLRPVEMFFMFDDELVAAEFVSGALNVTAPAEVRQYGEAFEMLASMAVYGDRARALIGEALVALA
ncbi:XRE family transcriptional regulator [Actinomadura sp. KC216]|uniref:helix-turn-helix domain-containing protein n=1 Tax=Actinomadura sp. KC216 TaxID=2530370 RepID=UPI0010518861|nr:helix-turn-helix transcriptional regulator [Actinomadura sp. KC216]TDB86262.1 XRE family transcriptional regulator [Actinomadura sp. KC216]